MKRTEWAIAANGVCKNYVGGTPGAGLNGFDLEVQPSSVCALLGPNGAGKTTAIKILTTLLDFEDGQASVAGFDVRSHARQVRQRIGLVGQYAAVDEILTGRQNLVMFGQLYHLSHRQAQQRADELLDQFVLADSANLSVSKYSGGMRRRLDLAASLIVSPLILFVDEPTTGLDPVGRQQVWNALRSLVDTGMTMLLTTQYLEEADQLADQIAILKTGRVIAEGTSSELKAMLGGDWLDLVLRLGTDTTAVTEIVQQVAAGPLRVDARTNRISAPVKDRTRALVTVATALSEAQIEPEDIYLRRPTLDEVFIHLTGTTAQLEVTQ